MEEQILGTGSVRDQEMSGPLFPEYFGEDTGH